MKFLSFTIELIQPLLATSFGGDANDVVSANYIPGSLIRGALIGRYLQTNSLSHLNNSDPKHQKLFLSSEVCYLNAYPIVNTKEGVVRTLPVPLSWHKEKDADEFIINTPIYDFCRSGPSVMPNNNKSKQLSSPFFYFADPPNIDDEDNNGDIPIILTSPDRYLKVHMQRSPQKGSSTQKPGEGAVFRYNSLNSGQQFKSAILFDENVDEEFINTIRQLLTTVLFLGNSHSAGYGKVLIHLDEENNDANFCEFPIPRSIAEGELFNIVLLSNALIRDNNGQLQSSLPAEWLSTKLFNKDDLLEELKENFSNYKKAEVIGAFNRKWQLPIPKQLSLKAGSVFWFTAKKNITYDELETLVNKGIGERRIDGFGRIAINLNYRELYITLQESEYKDSIGIKSDAGKTIARELLNRLAYRKFDKELVERINNHKLISSLPNNQLAKLRGIIHEAIIQGEAEKLLTDFFNNYENTYLEYPLNNRGSFKEWIFDLLKGKLGYFNNPDIALGINKQIKPQITDEARLYKLRLIDGILAQAIKRND